MSKCDTPDCDKEANWYGSKSLCTPCLHKAAVDAPRLREGIKAYLELEIETHELKELIE